MVIPKEEKLRLLKTQHLFLGVEDVVIEKVLPFIQFKIFQKKETVIQSGSPGDCLLTLIEGRLQVIAKVDDSREVVLAFIEPKTYFGELSIIDDQPRVATVIAITESVIALIPKEQARWLFYYEPKIAETLLKHFSKIIRQQSFQKQQLGVHRAYTRIYAVLMNEAEVKTNNMLIIEKVPNQQALAMMANVSRETVSRAINALIQAGILEKKNRQFIVHRPEMMKRLSNGEIEIQHNKESPTLGAVNLNK